jgi:DNA repair protein RecO (recombination protein O)
MEWRDRGIVLSARPHGEGGLILQLLTEHHGRHAGLVRAGAGPNRRGLYQPGNLVTAAWRARLAEHLGHFACEPLRATAALYLDDPPRLAALSSACAVLEAALPERQSHPAIHAGAVALIEALAWPYWAAAYVRWEVGLLAALGYGLDLATCAVTGVPDALSHVSPRTGRAVSAGAAEPYRDRLLPLPAFLSGAGEADPAAIQQGLELTGYFLERYVFAATERDMPAARRRLAQSMSRA